MKMRPVTLVLDLSYACNLDCITCLCPQIDRNTGHPTLPLSIVREAIDEFVEMGGEKIEIYGGEPLLVKHIYDVVKYASSAGLRVEMTTNGTKITKVNAQKLLSAGLSQLSISIDGGPEAHERVRGRGTFAKSMLGAYNVLSAVHETGNDDFFLNIHVTISQVNANAFAEIIKHVVGLGSTNVMISVFYFSRISPEITRQMEKFLNRKAVPLKNHWELPSNLLVKAEQIDKLKESVKATKDLARQHNIRVIIDPVLDEAFNLQSVLEGKYTLHKPCKVFETTLILGPDGAVGSCPMLTHFEFSNFPAESLSKIWEENDLFRYLRQHMQSAYLPVCSSCCAHSTLV